MASLALWPCLSHADPVVDVLVLYIGAAQQTQSGRDIDARIASYIEYSNRTFQNSNVNMRLRLVGSERINVDYTHVTSSNLSALRSNREVAQLRQKYGADLVTLLNLRQPMSGGYVCGIAYLPGGSSSTGRLSSNAASAGFSLVGVDCGLNTFIHELGHNMGLGHSHIQNSNGSVWPWARGHGVQGSFSTVMAYPQSYGTRNQLQRFSNPLQRECSGQPCGVDRNQANGADATRNLNSLGAQVAAFMPSVVQVDQPAATPQPCTKPAVDGNLIANGEFNSLEGWSALFGASRLMQRARGGDCVDQMLAVTNRTQPYSDAYQSLSDSVKVNRTYSFNAKFGVSGASRDTVRVALQIREGSRVRYQYLEPISVTSSELTAYGQEFTLDATTQPDNVGLVIYGPQAGVDILADELTLVEVTAANEPAAPTTVLHEGFERQARGWSSFGGSQTAFSTHAFEGSYSLRNHSRSYTYSGPMREVTGLFEAGVSYEITTSVFIQDSGSNSGNAAIWVYYVDDQGGHWQQVLSTPVTTNQWRTVTGSFVIAPVGEITQMRLLIGGPRRSANLFIDELSVIRQ